jgi:hypothetical protein
MAMQQQLHQALAVLQQANQQQAADIRFLGTQARHFADLAEQRAIDLVALRASTSWRLTAPLRRLSRWIRSMR